MKKLCLLFTLAVASLGAAPSKAETPPDVGRILEKARVVQEKDLAAWSKFRFRRSVRRELLGEEREILKKERLVFVVTPSGEGFDEELVSLDGKIPSAGEIKRHRRLARFTRHYKILSTEDSSKEGGETGVRGFSLRSLLRLSSYRYGARETRNGRSCHRLDFEPDKKIKGDGVENKLAEAVVGSLWIEADGFHVVQAEAATVKPVPFAFHLGKLIDMRLTMENAPVTPSIWLPKRIEIETKTRVFLRIARKRNFYTYSDFAVTNKD